ncbi:MAG: hypothetical protein GC131_09205 [Alphaproteobacteria bacterium]|nr:hypothetical protein [Alphaproteobacteria bacterium]
MSFHDLEMKFGSAAAFHFLMEIEKVARIQSWAMSAIDPETRLANAVRAQDAMASSAAALLAA